MKSKSLILTLAIIVLSVNIFAQEINKFIDSRDGKTYLITKINNQIWMAENLAFKTDKGCFAYGNDSSNISRYGYLYLPEIANEICPAGWHLPANSEWDELEAYLGFTSPEGNKLKSISGWMGTNESATNESGFSALPCGCFSFNGKFCDEGFVAYWCSRPEEKSDNSSYWYLDSKYSSLQHKYTVKKYAFSVRCVKD
jgi:uncharacterized protein (TIGR02145 family)